MLTLINFITGMEIKWDSVALESGRMLLTIGRLGSENFHVVNTHHIHCLPTITQLFSRSQRAGHWRRFGGDFNVDGNSSGFGLRSQGEEAR